MVLLSLREGSPKATISSIRSWTASSSCSGEFVAITTITLSRGEPVLKRKEFIVCLIYSDISLDFLFLRKASASSINRIIPFFYASAQSNNLFNSLTAKGPRGAISDPTITQYSKPDFMASFFANKVFPVPGGP